MTPHKIAAEAQAKKGNHAGKAPTLGDIVNWFKTMTTNQYIRGVKQNGWSPFGGKLWQRNYYEHIIRNEEELNHVRQYIAENPFQLGNRRRKLRCSGQALNHAGVAMRGRPSNMIMYIWTVT